MSNCQQISVAFGSSGQQQNPVWLARTTPSYIELAITDGPAASAQLAEGLDPGRFPLGLRKLHVQLAFGKLGDNFSGNQHTMKVTLSTFPIVGATAVTGHNTQGRTMSDGLFVTTFKAKPSPPAQWAYVVLSRATSLQGLHLLSEFSGADAARCAQSDDFRLHEEWMRHQEQLSTRKLENWDAYRTVLGKCGEKNYPRRGPPHLEDTPQPQSRLPPPPPVYYTLLKNLLLRIYCVHEKYGILGAPHLDCAHLPRTVR